VMALMIGAMIIQGIQPGPAVMTEQPSLFWGLIVSMWIGNLMLLVLNLPLIGMWVKMITIPYRYLFPMILVFCAIGVFSLNNANFDVYLMALFGFIGYIFKKLDCEPAPLLLGGVHPARPDSVRVDLSALGSELSWREEPQSRVRVNLIVVVEPDRQQGHDRLGVGQDVVADIVTAQRFYEALRYAIALR